MVAWRAHRSRRTTWQLSTEQNFDVSSDLDPNMTSNIIIHRNNTYFAWCIGLTTSGLRKTEHMLHRSKLSTVKVVKNEQMSGKCVHQMISWSLYMTNLCLNDRCSLVNFTVIKPCLRRQGLLWFWLWPSEVLGTTYKIGKNYDSCELGPLNGK